MSQRSFVLWFHNLCYTRIKMQAKSFPEKRASWPTWAKFIRDHELEGLATWALEAAGPLTVLGAQALYLGSPLLRPTVTNAQFEALARLLEDPHEAQAFANFLREEVSG